MIPAALDELKREGIVKYNEERVEVIVTMSPWSLANCGFFRCEVSLTLILESKTADAR